MDRWQSPRSHWPALGFPRDPRGPPFLSHILQRADYLARFDGKCSGANSVEDTRAAATGLKKLLAGKKGSDVSAD